MYGVIFVCMERGEFGGIEGEMGHWYLWIVGDGKAKCVETGLGCGGRDDHVCLCPETEM